ncbi:MAG: Amuc_1101 family PilM-like pilus complex protein [Terrimicrobiaceae bacterium]
MAAPSRIFALNLGMQTVSLAEFHTSANGGLTLHNTGSVELIVDPAADATRPAQLEAAVAELRAKLSLPAKSLAAVTLPSQSVFSRFVKLPGSTADDVEQIIGFEAQQNVPFPIDEVVWDHQIMGASRDGSWDVALVAIKADQLSETVASVAKGGLRISTIDASPVAIYNAFRFNYADLPGCSLLVDVGSRTTNLIFIEGQRLFSRTIPVGGNSISAAVAKEFKQDITLAERLKIEKGFVGLGGAYEEPSDPTVAKISKVVRNTMTRLHAEIARSISFYRQSQAGSAPVRAYLSGGTVSMQYMVEFFSEKLQIPIEHFNALRNVAVSSQTLADTVAGKAHIMGELVGAALRQAGSSPVEINLRPKELVREQDIAKRKPFLALSAVCLLAAVGIWYAYFTKATEIARQKLDEANALAAGLEGFATKFDALNAEKKSLETSAGPLLLAVSERTAWSAILDELGKHLPPRFIWITGLSPLSGGKPVPIGGKPAATPAATTSAPPKPGQPAAPSGPPAIDALEITGLYLSNPPNENEARIIDQFVERLQKSPLFKIEANSKVVTQRTTPDGQSWAYSYTIVLPLANPILLP